MRFHCRLNMLMCGWAVWILLISHGYSQSHKVDALSRQLQQSQSEEARISILLNLSASLTRNHPEEAFVYAEEANKLAAKYGREREKTLAIMHMGNSKWNQAYYDEAFVSYLETLRLFNQMNDSLGIAHAYHNIARVDWRLGNYPEAMSNELQALRIRENHEDSTGIAESLSWIGILKADLSEYSEAREYYYQALDLAGALGDRQMVADILNHIGRSWRKEDVYGKALAAHNRSLAIYESLGDTLGISDYYNNVGSIYRRQGNYQEALKHFFTAIPIQERLNDQEGQADGYNDIGTTYSQMGQFRRAIPYLEKALDISLRTGLTDDIRYAYASLAATYDSLGDYERAFAYHKQYSEFKDSLLSNEKNNQIAHLHIRYESEKKSQQIENLELKSQRNGLIGLLLGGMMLLLLLMGVFMLYRSRAQRRLNRELARKNNLILLEKQKSEELLLNIFPDEIAEELRFYGRARARSYQEVSVLFSDFRGFTRIAEQLSPRELVAELHLCFEAFDRILQQYNVEKIKTIGDAYMCSGGLPVEDPKHAVNVVRAALAMQKFLTDYKMRKIEKGETYFEARIGVHSGPVVAGIVGIHKFSYDIWGDTVNMAAKMESCGEVGKVNISQDTFELIQNQFICKYRGKVHAKHKGEVDMYFVEREI